MTEQEVRGILGVLVISCIPVFLAIKHRLFPRGIGYFLGYVLGVCRRAHRAAKRPRWKPAETVRQEPRLDWPGREDPR